MISSEQPLTRRVAVISAGLSVPSSTRLLADQVMDAVRDLGTARGVEVAFDVIELRTLAVPLAQMMTTGLIPHVEVTRAHEHLAAADAVIAVTPVFTASYAGLFKMFLDTLDVHLLDGTPVLIAATAGTPRHSLVLEHAVRPLFSYLHAGVLPTAVFAATEDFGAGAATGLQARVQRAAGELVTAIGGHLAAAPNATDRSSVPGAAAAPPVSTFEQLLRGHSG